MWVNEGLAILGVLFPEKVLTVNGGEGDRATANALNMLALTKLSTPNQIRVAADRLGLEVREDGGVKVRS